MRTGPISYNAAYELLRARGYEPVPGSSRFENAAGETGRIVPAQGSGDTWYVECESSGFESNSSDSFHRGFDAGATDRASGAVRQLCTTGTGTRPPVVKRHDRDYYHGYKASAEGAKSEPAAYLQYRAKHRGRVASESTLRANGGLRAPVETLTDPQAVRSVLRKLRVKSGLTGTSASLGGRWSIRFDYSRGDKMFVLTLVHHGANKERSIALSREDVETRSKSQWLTAQTFRLTEPAIDRFADQLIPAMRNFDAKYAANPAHLGLDGNFSFSVGTEGMRKNASSKSDLNFNDLVLQWHPANSTYKVTRGAIKSPEVEPGVVRSVLVTSGAPTAASALESAARAHPYSSGIVLFLLPDGDLVQIGSISGHRFVPGGSDTMQSVEEFVARRRGGAGKMKRNAALTAGTCDQCGEPIEIVTATGHAYHVAADGSEDFAADADHQPYEGALAANGGEFGQRRLGRISMDADALQEKLGEELLIGQLYDIDGVVYRVGGFSGGKVALWRESRAADHEANGTVAEEMDLVGVELALGPRLIADALAAPDPARFAAARARTGHSPRVQAAYRTLERLCKAGVLNDLIAEARK